MEAKINIAEILKDKPQGTKLYSSACGKCKLEEVDDKSFKISFYNSKFGFMNGGEGYLDKNGKLYDDGECVVFPSREMRDWSKFAWKKGDVLVHKDGDVHIIFEKFVDDTYCSFIGKYYLWKENNNTEWFYENERLLTSAFQKASKEVAQTYINVVKKRLGGKLNRKTLEIEKPKFKDGDIVSSEIRFIDSEDVIVETYIVHNDYLHGEKLNYYAGYNGKASMIDYNSFISPENTSVKNTFLRYATEEEKQQLFEALAKENKAWDAEKKEVVDLKPKVEFKPFDKVVAYGELTKEWVCDIFSHYSKNYEGKEIITCIGGGTYYKALPYNEETIKLLGTTKDVKD